MSNFVDSSNYLVIQGWMISDLKLKGLDLLIFAIIYGYSQDGDSSFKGTISYLMDWTNSSYKGVQKSLNSLINRGLISKEVYFKGSVRMVSYSVSFLALHYLRKKGS